MAAEGFSSPSFIAIGARAARVKYWGARALLGLLTALTVPAVALALPAVALADPLKLVRIDGPQMKLKAEELSSAGFDVVEGTVSTTSAQLVVSSTELESLVKRGLNPQVLSEGRPFRSTTTGPVVAAVPDGYLSVAEIEERMRALADAHPALSRLVDITDTYGPSPTFEGRHLYALKISDNVDLEEDEPNFLMVSAHHCREIGTPVIALEAAARFTDQYGVDATVTGLVDTYEIWIAPLWNPDGYAHVFEVDNLWRKNRRVFADTVGVDLNRNYSAGWSATCSGSSDPASNTYKGPSSASEVETQTMIEFSRARRFAKVIDYHSAGREVLWGYSCLGHPFAGFWLSEATSLANEMGYEGRQRTPSADGEHQQWQFARMGSHAFLVETLTQIQPPHQDALAEADKVWDGTLWLLARPISVSGHVLDGCTETPITARIDYLGVTLENDESNHSGGQFGRYHATLPPGDYTLEFSAPGYESTRRDISVTLESAHLLEVELFPSSGECWTGDAGLDAGGEPPDPDSGQSDPGPADSGRVDSGGMDGSVLPADGSVAPIDSAVVGMDGSADRLDGSADRLDGPAGKTDGSAGAGGAPDFGHPRDAAWGDGEVREGDAAEADSGFYLSGGGCGCVVRGKRNTRDNGRVPLLLLGSFLLARLRRRRADR